MADQIFCITCKHYVRRSPEGRSNSGDCTLNPIWSTVNLATTHWCNYWASGNQRSRLEMYKFAAPEEVKLTIQPDSTEVIPQIDAVKKLVNKAVKS